MCNNMKIRRKTLTILRSFLCALCSNIRLTQTRLRFDIEKLKDIYLVDAFSGKIGSRFEPFIMLDVKPLTSISWLQTSTILLTVSRRVSVVVPLLLFLLLSCVCPVFNEVLFCIAISCNIKRKRKRQKHHRHLQDLMSSCYVVMFLS